MPSSSLAVASSPELLLHEAISPAPAPASVSVWGLPLAVTLVSSLTQPAGEGWRSRSELGKALAWERSSELRGEWSSRLVKPLAGPGPTGCRRLHRPRGGSQPPGGCGLAQR